MFVSVYLLNVFSCSFVSTVADPERATGSGDKETTGLFHSDAPARCVGGEPAVTYVAPLASSSAALLAASQQLYVSSQVHVWKHTQHKHTPEAFAPAHAHVHCGLH